MKTKEEKLQAARDWKKKNPERMRAYKEAYRSKNREWNLEAKKREKVVARMACISHYSKGTMSCACCGEKEIDFLTMDHINGGGLEHKRREKFSHLAIWLRKNKFPDGFQILCYNCNCSKGHTRDKKCPHQR